MLDDIGLEDGIGHPEFGINREELLLLQVIAVMTVQVTDRARGFCEDLELSIGSWHRAQIRGETDTLQGAVG